jgi:hypothetical protein
MSIKFRVCCHLTSAHCRQSVRESVTSEVRDRLQAIYNLELQQQMSAISRVQVRIK